MPAGVARDECEAPCRQGPADSHVHGLVKVAPAAVDPDDRDGPSSRDKRADQRPIEPNPIFGVGAYEALLVAITHGLRSSMPRVTAARGDERRRYASRTLSHSPAYRRPNGAGRRLVWTGHIAQLFEIWSGPSNPVGARGPRPAGRSRGRADSTANRNSVCTSDR